MSTKKLNGRVAMVTGAGSGIGRATAILFAAEGAKVSLVGRDRAKLEAVVKEIRTRGGEAMVAAGDVSVEEEASRIVYESVGRFGPMRILVNNAGVYSTGNVLTTPIEEWDRIMAIDLRAVYMLTKRVVPEMDSAGGGVIVNVSSTLGVRPFPDTLAYSTAKAALNMFTKCCALDLAAKKIRVNTVSPAVVDTPIHDANKAKFGDRAEWEKAMTSFHPLGRIGKPEEVAKAIFYLASDDAGWVTGENLCVDGGVALL